ncbi:Diuretic hormone receptor [Nymphon striatum]|nr:Diuretic hormone receptor [Nymphon striatum]
MGYFGTKNPGGAILQLRNTRFDKYYPSDELETDSDDNVGNDNDSENDSDNENPADRLPVRPVIAHNLDSDWNKKYVGVNKQFLNKHLGNITDPTFCNATKDKLLCWPITAVNTTTFQPCEFTLNNVEYDKSKNASRFCQANGTWAPQANYSSCTYITIEDLDWDDVSNVKHATTIYKVGYFMSLIAVTVAAGIFMFLS